MRGTREELASQPMRRACELAIRGQGFVEPNPMVGCVIVNGTNVIGEGWHTVFGGPHAEVNALNSVRDATQLSTATMYVTLEPCCHQGKTPPCTEAILKSGIRHVVVALEDPFPQVANRGIQQLMDAGIMVEIGDGADEADRLLSPYLKLQRTGRPWVVAKWAMTLDGKIATRSRNSQWISSSESRALVHQLRGRVDAILVGSGTVSADDPLLTARAGGPRIPLRVVLDSSATLRLDSQLVRTANEAPILLCVTSQAEVGSLDALESAGVMVFRTSALSLEERLQEVLVELGRRSLTNVLVEGGGTVLGTFLDIDELDEVHVFVAPKLVGGASAVTPLGAKGIAMMNDALSFDRVRWQEVGDDLYFTASGSDDVEGNRVRGYWWSLRRCIATFGQRWL